MGQCRNEVVGETGDPRENPPTSGIVRHDSHIRTSGVTPPGIEPYSPWWKAGIPTTTPPRPPNTFLGMKKVLGQCTYNINTGTTSGSAVCDSHLTECNRYLANIGAMRTWKRRTDGVRVCERLRRTSVHAAATNDSAYSRRSRSSWTDKTGHEASMTLEPKEFMNSTPLLVFDINKQDDHINTGVVDCRFKMMATEDIPSNTQAYALIIHDHLAMYNARDKRASYELFRPGSDDITRSTEYCEDQHAAIKNLGLTVWKTICLPLTCENPASTVFSLLHDPDGCCVTSTYNRSHHPGSRHATSVTEAHTKEANTLKDVDSMLATTVRESSRSSNKHKASADVGADISQVACGRRGGRGMISVRLLRLIWRPQLPPALFVSVCIPSTPQSGRPPHKSSIVYPLQRFRLYYSACSCTWKESPMLPTTNTCISVYGDRRLSLAIRRTAAVIGSEDTTTSVFEATEGSDWSGPERVLLCLCVLRSRRGRSFRWNDTPIHAESFNLLME
ncbi:hypothetical protein PR048_008390 [Dryococelus australis]|uniref:Double jelly roll-like domain-containing protein n=1 Tax=Dryococelus australis TaxID=614101 RepID=A0ABQ9HWZ7_9NEOP|nr:hypothetical protein PR048_008390 [Dryococelus australis]